MSKRRKKLDVQAAQRPTGVVKWFNLQKGFGFIVPDAGGEDVFVHIAQVNISGLETLTEGLRVSFEIQSQPDGRTSAAFLQIESDGTTFHLSVVPDVPTENGVLKWFNLKKGYGFIAPISGGKDAFLHIREIEKAGLDVKLFSGARDNELHVSYSVKKDSVSGRVQAVNIRID